MDQVLELKFKSESGKVITISLDSPREDLTDTGVKETMTGIIGQNALVAPNDEAVVGIDSARIVTKTIQEFLVA